MEFDSFNEEVYADVGGGIYNSAPPKKKNYVPLIAAVGAAAAVLLLAAAVFAFFCFQVMQVRSAITSIGTVRMESLEQIERAEDLYEKLPSYLQSQVKNTRTLKDARTEYARLSGAVDRAARAIDAAAAVTSDPEEPYVSPADGHLVQAAREAYDALEADGLTGYLADRLPELEMAEAGYTNALCIDLFLDACDLEEQAQYPQAIDLYQELIDRFPENKHVEHCRFGIAECLCAMAQSEYTGKNYEAAIELYQQALASEPDHYTAAVGAMDCTAKLLEQSFKDGEYENVRKQLDAAQERYGVTSEVFENLEKKLQDKLDKLRPKNEKNIKSNINWGYGKLIVQASSQDAVVKLESVSDPSKYKIFYVRAYEKATVSVGNGTYRVKIACGDTWYGNDVMFGEKTERVQLKSTMNWTTTREGSWIYYWERTLRLTSLSSMDASPISAGSF